jgi:hypothetical protein
MHTHGTAVLDRPAEATILAEALLPVHDVSADALTPEPAESTNDAAKALAPGNGDVHDLAYAELAVALSASGVRPQYFWSADSAQLMEWATQGVALLGIDRVRHYARRTCFINRHITDHRIPAQHRAEYARMWPRSGPKAVQSCHDAAWRLAFPSPASQITPASSQARSALHG